MTRLVVNAVADRDADDIYDALRRSSGPKQQLRTIEISMRCSSA